MGILISCFFRKKKPIQSSYIEKYNQIYENNKNNIDLLKIKLPYCVIMDKNMKTGFFINIHYNFINYFDNYSDIEYIKNKIHNKHCVISNGNNVICECNKEKIILKYRDDIEINNFLLFNDIRKKQKNIQLSNIDNYYYFFDNEFLCNKNFNINKYLIKLDNFLSNNKIFIINK